MYDYKKFGLGVLTSALEIFENRFGDELSSDKIDKIWDITLRVKNNNRVTRVMGRYWNNKQLIEIFPNRFNGNLMAFKDTILHELAHHITYVLYGYYVQSHGPEWKSICHILGCDSSATKNMREYNTKWAASRKTSYYKQYIIS